MARDWLSLASNEALAKSAICEMQNEECDNEKDRYVASFVQNKQKFLELHEIQTTHTIIQLQSITSYVQQHNF